MKLKINNRFRKDLSDLTDLKESIKNHGLIHPIVIDSDGNLIAGERRYTACKELGIDPIYRTVDFDNPEQAQIDENTIRKDFTPSEIYEIGQYYNEKLSRQGKRTDINLVTNCNEVKPIETVSKIVSKSIPTLSKINQIFESVNTDIKEKVNSGKISIDKGYKEVKKDNEKRLLQEKFINASKEYKEDENIKIYNSDFRNNNIDNNSLDLILTDPPYPKEYLNLWDNLFKFAESKLKPSRYLIAFSGQLYLNIIFNYLTKYNSLSYYWLCSLWHKGTIGRVDARSVLNETKPILIIQKEPFKKNENYFSDLVVSEKAEKIFHPWQQNYKANEYLLDKFTEPNNLVCDPFMGSGTNALLCKNKLRKFIGYEIDNKSYLKIKGRLVS